LSLGLASEPTPPATSVVDAPPPTKTEAPEPTPPTTPSTGKKKTKGGHR
jgi:hypothetical protein